MPENSCSPGPNKKSFNSSTQVLLVSHPRYNFEKVPNTAISIARCSMGAIFWLLESTKTFDELWLDTEIEFDQPFGEEELPEPAYNHQENGGLFLVDFLRSHADLIPDLLTVRILTRNPAHIKYIRESLEGLYNICHNLPANHPVMSISTQT